MRYAKKFLSSSSPDAREVLESYARRLFSRLPSQMDHASPEIVREMEGEHIRSALAQLPSFQFRSARNQSPVAFLLSHGRKYLAEQLAKKGLDYDDDLEKYDPNRGHRTYPGIHYTQQGVRGDAGLAPPRG